MMRKAIGAKGVCGRRTDVLAEMMEFILELVEAIMDFFD